MKLDWERYLEHIRADGDLLVGAAADHLDDVVPWCEGWVGRDVLAHTGVVHRHKTAIVAGALMDNPNAQTAPSGDDRLLAWYRRGLDELLAALAAADPATPVYTWHSPDQSVGFWIRRMAHETVIHRGDAESTAGSISPLDPALAADGVDEVLGPIMCAATDDPLWEFKADGRTAELRMTDTGDIRHLSLGTGKHCDSWLYGRGAVDDPAAVIESKASDLDLWAWGRAESSVLHVAGDTSIVETIRTVVAEVTG